METKSRTTPPEGEELLEGLYIVQSYLERSNEKLAAYWELEKQYRSSLSNLKTIEHIPYIKASEQKPLYGLFVAGIAFSVISTIFALFTGNMTNVLLGLICVAIFVFGRVKQNKAFLTAGVIGIVLMILAWLTGLARTIPYYHSIGNDATIILTVSIQVVGFIIAAIVAAILLKKYNKRVSSKNSDIDAQNEEIARKNREIDIQNQQIAQHNLDIDNQRKQCMIEITRINREMVDETSWWFPVDYYALDANEQFIALVRNHRADTVKEMINAYVQDEFHSQVVNNQEAMRAQLDQSLQNQQQMLKLQRISNVLLAGNLVANMATAANTSSIAASSAEIARNTAATASNTAATAASSAATARNTAAAAQDADAMARRIGAKWQ